MANPVRVPFAAGGAISGENSFVLRVSRQHIIKSIDTCQEIIREIVRKREEFLFSGLFVTTGQELGQSHRIK